MLAGATGTASYTAPAAPGTYTFSYTVKDNSTPPATSNPAVVTVTVTGVVAKNDSASTVVGTPVTIDILANDTSFGPAIINPAAVTVFQPAAGGGSVVANAAGTATYTPPAVAGTYTFGYTVKDNAAVPASSNLATVTVKVGVAPVAANDTATALVSSAVTINVIGNDTATLPAAIDPATVVLSTPTGGTAVANANGTVTYTPPAAAGTYTFTYTVKDNLGTVSNAATVTVTVNTPPVAGNDTASAVISTTVNINVIANDTASNSSINSTTVNIVSPATCGTTSVLANGTVNFTAPAAVPAAPGTCSFSYVVSDTFVPPALSNVATVTVTITPPLPPVAANDTATTTTSSTAVINVIANDTSSSSTINPATIVVGVPTGGTAVANLNGTVSYTAPAVAGTYSFTYTVKDNHVPALTSNVATVTVTVNPQFVFPTAVNDSATLVAGSSAVINVAANDIAGTNPITPLTVSSVTVVAAPAHGTAVANVGGTGTITYTPTAGFNGVDSFTYNIKDTLGNVSANNATVSLTVTTPVSTESITVTRAQFTLSNASWRIDGTTNVPVAGQTMKIFNSATVPADAVTGLLATVNVSGNGSFTWSSATGSPAPNALRKISILSSSNPNNNKLEQVTVTVR